MSETNLEETQPTSPDAQQETPVEPVKSPKKGGAWKWIVGGLLAVILIGAAGAMGGYYAGIADRQKVEQNQRDLAASTQFQLGVADMEAGRYDFAKRRFEYVIQLNSAYPGVLENMAKITIITSATATPTVAPTATPAPTLDLSGVEALLVQSKQLLAASDWNGAITALDMLRKQNTSFKTLEVDGLYYLALRNLGMQKIANGNLEAGLFSLAEMKNFGPIDAEAANLQEMAAMYISASRYFGWDWANAIKYLGEVYKTNPSIIDTSHRTVADRYRESLAKYGDQLGTKEKWCDAVPYYEQSLAIGQDQKVADAYNKANNKCIASQPTATPTVDPASVPTTVVTSEEPPVVTTEPPPAADPTTAPT
jgi:tetratricopeptide (TPR) repeat protein